jgi:hypothetical protein
MRLFMGFTIKNCTGDAIVSSNRSFNVCNSSLNIDVEILFSYILESFLVPYLFMSAGNGFPLHDFPISGGNKGSICEGWLLSNLLGSSLNTSGSAYPKQQIR